MFNEPLELDVRKRAYDCIKKSPGLHFREIQRRAGLSTGSIDYHVRFLQLHGLVRTEKKGGFVYYYPTDKKFDEEEKELLNLLRQENIRHILIFLIEKKEASASEIASELGMSPSNLSWYLSMLMGKGLIAQRKGGRFRFYSVRDKKKIILCLITYKTSFLDNMVDRFIEAWEE